MGPIKRTCPNDGATMLVTQNEAMGIAFVCPVCEIAPTNADLNETEDKKHAA